MRTVPGCSQDTDICILINVYIGVHLTQGQPGLSVCMAAVCVWELPTHSAGRESQCLSGEGYHLSGLGSLD